jgi:hypothetical protein
MRSRNPMQKEKNIGKLYLYTLRSDAHFFGSYFRPRYGVGPWHTESKEKGAAECLGGCLSESRPTTIKMQHIMTRTPSFFIETNNLDGLDDDSHHGTCNKRWGLGEGLESRCTDPKPRTWVPESCILSRLGKILLHISWFVYQFVSNYSV